MTTLNETTAQPCVRAAARSTWISSGLARISAGLGMAAGGVGSWTRPWWRWGSRTSVSQAGLAQMVMMCLLIHLWADGRVGHDHHGSCTCHGWGCRVMSISRWSWTLAPA